MKVAAVMEFQAEMPLMDISVLYVEDDSSSRLAIAHMLARRVSQVYTAEDGLAGLEVFKAKRPALVISDVMMPRMDGCAMCREIMALDPEVKIIMLSSCSESEALLKSIDLGVLKYLVKPIKMAALVDAIGAAMAEIEKKKAFGRALAEARSMLSFVEHDTALLQEYVERSIGDNLEEFANIRLHNRPMGAISGDFFCSARHREDLYLLLADASGHGFSAMVPAMGIPRRFRESAAKGFSLLAIADEINAILRGQALTGHFVAATLVRLTRAGRCIEVLNCGNPPAILMGMDGALMREFHSSTFPLGMADSQEMRIDVERFELDGKASLYLYTDGLVDTLGQSMIDCDMLKNIFMETPTTEVFDRMLHLVEEALQLGQPDDVTMAEIIIDQSDLVPQWDALETGLIALDFPSAQLTSGQLQIAPKECLLNTSVLLVEHDDDIRAQLSRTLGHCVGTVHVAGNGREGLRLYCENQPDVVISGIMLPGMSGIAMVEAVRNENAAVPIIMIGNAGEQIYTEMMFDLGVSRFVQDPLDVGKLFRAIADCVERADHACDMRLSALAFDATTLAIAITDKNREIVSVNAAFCAITGYTREEVIGRNPKLLSSGRHDASFYQGMWKSLNETGSWSGEIWNCRKNGEMLLAWETISVVKDAAGQSDHYISVFSDVGNITLAEQRFPHFFKHKTPAMLPARALLHERLREVLSNAQGNSEIVGLMYLGLDHFQSLNEIVRPELSDDLLSLIARRLCDCVRDSDLVSQLGDDEFVILLPNVASRGMVWNIAAKILASFRKPCQIGQSKLHVASSIGISLYPEDGDCTEALIRNASSAMFLAQTKGRNTVRFSDFQKRDVMPMPAMV